MTDISEVTQVILREREARDRGWFDDQLTFFHDHSRVRVSWHDGSAAEFIAKSKQNFENGAKPVHRMGAPIVHVRGHRAIAQAPAELSIVHEFSGVQAQVVACARLVYRLEKLAGAWKICLFDTIYERDSLVPLMYGATIPLDETLLARFRQPYMYLAYHLHEQGIEIRDDLLGDDRPEPVDALYAEAKAWLADAS